MLVRETPLPVIFFDSMKKRKYIIVLGAVFGIVLGGGAAAAKARAKAKRFHQNLAKEYGFQHAYGPQRAESVEATCSLR